VGKLADLIVLDKNLFTIKPEEISDAKVVLTLLGGQAVSGDLATLAMAGPKTGVPPLSGVLDSSPY